MTPPILEVEDLRVSFTSPRGVSEVLHGISLSLQRGQILALVGESGSGKSVTGLSVMGLLPRQASITRGCIRFDGREITHRVPRELRGAGMAMVFQNPRAALNPTRRIRNQLADVILAHEKPTAAELHRRLAELMEQVSIADKARCLAAYPHELSGGLCQRIVIAMAIACSPDLIIADEPTTGLDVLTQKAIMDLLLDLTRARGMSMILVTHDLGMAAQYCDDVAVMNKGYIVESGRDPHALFLDPGDAYTRRLVNACPTEQSRLGPQSVSVPPASAAPLLDVRNLVKTYGRDFRAVDDVSFTIGRGESLGLIGESGSGKSTISRLVSRLINPDGGQILFGGQPIGQMPADHFYRTPLRRQIQFVFQDAAGSLNPRFTAFDAIADPIRRLQQGETSELGERVIACARSVGLPEGLLNRYPHQMSGGQCARVGIARAIAVDPQLLILDEPTAALDVLVQAEVLALLERLRREKGMSYLFVSHDLHVVRMLCSRMLILRHGKVVESGSCEEIFRQPRDAYTIDLLSAIPHFRPTGNGA
ncbi:nickel ABC transporter ATP-binding protein NikE [Gluconacetobacter asukensis]|uniref:ABC transporter ATP-binding protein n=1 Tax=Gluconacetobacter asukensis TaxID=1017181 RepID=A0A7W4J353_9PROT|nr:ABC transporter ATP-binding protein [Gluconacetobacter asukensis]MBB2173588.1 ABC transporter ATP-binding protein [Gluconacetobacter asukensis]